MDRTRCHTTIPSSTNPRPNRCMLPSRFSPLAQVHWEVDIKDGKSWLCYPCHALRITCFLHIHGSSYLAKDGVIPELQDLSGLPERYNISMDVPSKLQALPSVLSKRLADTVSLKLKKKCLWLGGRWGVGGTVLLHTKICLVG